jgi:hypothetical protein
MADIPVHSRHEKTARRSNLVNDTVVAFVFHGAGFTEVFPTSETLWIAVRAWPYHDRGMARFDDQRVEVTAVDAIVATGGSDTVQSTLLDPLEDCIRCD